MAVQIEDGPYPLDASQISQPDVPKGEVINRTFADSKIFPGTERNYAIYVPQQYDKSKPACLMVFQDGTGFSKIEGRPSKTLLVFDNLIHSGEMPVTIGLFIDPGVVPAQNENAQPRFNRSFEYDAIDDRYAKFLNRRNDSGNQKGLRHQRRPERSGHLRIELWRHRGFQCRLAASGSVSPRLHNGWDVHWAPWS